MHDTRKVELVWKPSKSVPIWLNGYECPHQISFGVHLQHPFKLIVHGVYLSSQHHTFGCHS